MTKFLVIIHIYIYIVGLGYFWRHCSTRHLIVSVSHHHLDACVAVVVNISVPILVMWEFLFYWCHYIS
jgi:hypothetical protein